MKDCSTCPNRPAPGTPYELTPCATCRPWEPADPRTQRYEDARMYQHGSLKEWLADDSETRPDTED